MAKQKQNFFRNTRAQQVSSGTSREYRELDKKANKRFLLVLALVTLGIIILLYFLFFT